MEAKPSKKFLAEVEASEVIAAAGCDNLCRCSGEC